MATIDPKGGNSNVTTDYDVMLNALANDYPEAIDASFDGDKQPLADQTAELDKRSEEGRGLARRAQEREEVIAEKRHSATGRAGDCDHARDQRRPCRGSKGRDVTAKRRSPLAPEVGCRHGLAWR